MIKTVLLLLACALGICAAAARSAAPAQAAGELRIWASPADGPLLEQLAHGFESRHPAMRVAVTLHGPDSTMASVVSGVAGLALLALGYVGLLYRNEQVNPLALAVRASAPYVLPTKDSVTDHSYPLACKITMFLNRAPGRAVDTKLKEYLHYMLSREGQEAVIREGGGYLPIIAPFAADELKKLD